MDIGTNYAHLYARNCNNKKRKIDKKKMIRTKSVVKPTSSLDGFLRYQNPSGFMDARSIVAKDPCVHEKVRYADRYIIDLRKRQEIYRDHYVSQQKPSFDGVYGVDTFKKSTVSEKSSVPWATYQSYVIDRIHNTYNAFSAYRRSLQHGFDFDFTLSPTRLWQLSLTGAMIFGMVSMSLIYRNLGQSVFAKEDMQKEIAQANEKKIEKVIESEAKSVEEEIVEKESEEKEEAVKEKENNDDKKEKKIDSASKAEDGDKKEVIIEDQEEKQSEENDEVEKKSIDSAVKKTEKEDNKKEESLEKDDSEDEEKTLEELAHEVVDGYPIEKMLPYILEQDPEVAKYLIAIAKQESGWGKRVPVLNGQDCYNYWGYRGIRRLMGSGGHTCFNSRKDAVETVAKRLEELIYEYDRKTANRLIVWKCGSSCAGHSQEGVDRWIGVVDTYYDKLSKK